MSAQPHIMRKGVVLLLGFFLAGCSGGRTTYVEEGPYYDGPYYYRGHGHERHESHHGERHHEGGGHHGGDHHGGGGHHH